MPVVTSSITHVAGAQEVHTRTLLQPRSLLASRSKRSVVRGSRRTVYAYSRLGDACDLHKAAGATVCKSMGCGWDELVFKCRVYHLPDSVTDDPMACAAVNRRGGYFGPWQSTISVENASAKTLP